MTVKRQPQIIHFPAAKLRRLAASKLEARGVPRADAQLVADSLV
jgi:LDH2 family malate/lactate/ureidoglycolate dehydrogenase